MRLLLPLSILLATATAVDNWKEAIDALYGDCGGKCMIAEFKDKGKCGDPASSSTTSCYCGKYVTVTSGVGTSFSTCFAKCKVDPNDMDYVQWSDDVHDLCGNDIGGTVSDIVTSTTSTKTGSATTSSAGESGDTETPAATTSGSDDEATPTPSRSPTVTPSETPTGAARTLGYPVGLAAGALAFLVYAL